ncbi:MAG: 2-octaprenylphenol hydroxylase [Deltaproteobacteria bacterium]|nr:2-octaprenylphenol hydroxylase [Deltaproteobacteria bacterium]
MGSIRQIGMWGATLARAAVIAFVAMLSVAAYTAGSIRRLAIVDRARRAEHRARQRGRLLRWSFGRLGATFIKVGQVMSSRADLLSPGVIAELRWLQDRVPPFPFAKVREVVEHELGAPIERWFRELSPVPVAAGSVAQVHHAVLTTGEEVAVKVLRPNLIARVRCDGRIMLWLAHFAHAVSRRARTADVVGHVRNLVAGILAQTDLRLERNNYERFRHNFANHPGLHFPHVYRSHSTRSVLTMEFVHGTRLEDATVEHLPQAAEVIRSAFFSMCFDHGFVHADLHPGNVLLRDDGVVVFLDVGLVKRLSRGLLEQVVDFTRCIAAGTAQDLISHLQRYHRYLAGTDWAAVEADAAAFIGRLRKRSILELELGAIVSELFALARKHKIRPMPEMTLVLLGMVTNEGMAKQLDPTADTMAELARYLGARVIGPNPPAVPRRCARGSQTSLRVPVGLMPLAPVPRMRLVIARPPRVSRPARITAGFLAARAAARKDH